MTEVVIALGSNIAPEKNIELAMAWFAEEFKVLKLTEVIKTEPIGMTDPHYFLNAGVLLETELDRNELDKKLREQEFFTK